MSDSAAVDQGIAQALRGVLDPSSGRDIVSLGYVQGMACHDGVAHVSLAIPPQAASPEAQEHIRQQAIAALGEVGGVNDVRVELQQASQLPPKLSLPNVKNIIAVGAGKGGVGKSTVALLAAVGLKRMGMKVGLLDADVYGPSLPKMTGTEGAQPMINADGFIVPPEFDGIKIVSMGYLVPPNQAVIWRGPMAQKYVREFLERGDWGELDYLIVDLPPGTGDIPLTLAQSIPLAGAVIVCTPQDLALIDAVKAQRMFQKLDVATLGMVENMSYYICPHCGERDHVFGEGGVERAAEKLGIPFLGGIPLNISIREFADAGRPSAGFTESADYVRDALEAVVKRLVEQVETRRRRSHPLPLL